MIKTKIKTPYDFGETGDFALDVLEALVVEIEAILGYTNERYNLSATDTLPTSGGWEVDDVILYTPAAGTPALMRLASTGPLVWEALGATGNFGNDAGDGLGVDLDSAFKGWIRNAKVSRKVGATSTHLVVAATAQLPATVCLPNGTMLQNTAAVEVDFTGAPDETYQVYAQQNGTTTGFTIARTLLATDISADTTKLRLAVVTYRTLGATPTADFRHIQNVEDFPGYAVPPLGVFHYTRSTAMGGGFDHNVETEFQVNKAVLNVGKTFDNDAGVRTFVCNRTGLWRIGASVRLQFATARTWISCAVRLKKNGTTELTRREVYITDATVLISPTEIHAEIPPQVFELAIGDKVSMFIKQKNNGGITSAEWASGWNDYDTAIWGEYLGPAS